MFEFLQALGPFDSTVGRLFLAIIIIAVVVFVGRFVMRVAWKLVMIAIAIVGAAWVLTTFLGF